MLCLYSPNRCMRPPITPLAAPATGPNLNLDFLSALGYTYGQIGDPGSTVKL